MNRLPMIFTALFLAAIPAPQPTDHVIVAHGVLTRNGKAGTLWILKTTDSLKFRDESIVQVTFTTRSGEPHPQFAAYDGLSVELTGEVKSVFHGNAVLNQVRTIGVMNSVAFALNAPEVARDVTSSRSSDSAAVAASRTPRQPYHHAYYLFLTGPTGGCEPCYIPLLITPDPLPDVARQRDPSLGVFIITYERDSVWEFRGAAVLTPSAIDPQTRTARINGRSYRYQEIAPQEVVNLLEHPFGSVPISRPNVVQKSVPGASNSELIGDFRLLLQK